MARAATKRRKFSNEFSSPDGIRTHDLFLERKRLQKSDLATSTTRIVQKWELMTRRTDQTARQKSDLDLSAAARVGQWDGHGRESDGVRLSLVRRRVARELLERGGIDRYAREALQFSGC